MTLLRHAEESGRRSAAVGLAGLLFFLVLSGLGALQIQRLSWKRDLIARVDAAVAATPVEAPGPAAWRLITQSNDEYRHIRVGGVFDHGRETLVQAVTEAGPGYWIMTPLLTDQGFRVLVNRGFVPEERGPQGSHAAGLVSGYSRVTGLLRISEPRGGFLRANRPGQGRWYSRDVVAIARTRGLGAVAPYFIDADAAPNPGGWPRGGLTVIRFSNNHLLYALTWFAMAAMVVIWMARTGLGANRVFASPSGGSR